MVEDTDAIASGVAEGHRYKVIQNDLGHFCGYVKTNFGDRWTYDDLRGYMGGLIDIHGGLTYGADEHGWIGFDCAHSGDVCILDGETVSDFGRSDYGSVWEVEDMEAECRKLARQVDTLETFAERFEERGWGHD